MINLGVRASISCDQHPVYECFAPLTAAVWRYRIGFEPLITLVGYEEEWLALRRSKLVLDELGKMGCYPSFVSVPEGYRSANVAQIARIYGALEPTLLASDVVMTADIDMWPLDRDWFCRHLPDPGTVTAYYANFPSRFPMCYVAAGVADWHRMLRLSDLRQDEAIKTHMRTCLSPSSSPEDAWQHDEEWLTARIYEFFTGKIQMVRRRDGEPFPDRIDRVAWPATIDLTNKLDAHLLRPAFARWDGLRELLTQLLPPDLIRWADEYIVRYAKLYSEEPKR